MNLNIFYSNFGVWFSMNFAAGSRRGSTTARLSSPNALHPCRRVSMQARARKLKIRFSNCFKINDWRYLFW